VFRRAAARTIVRIYSLHGVLAGDSRVPVVVSRLLICGPEIGPKANRFGSLGAGLDDDAQRHGGKGKRKSGHKQSLSTGEQHLRLGIIRAGHVPCWEVLVSGWQIITYEERWGWPVCQSDSDGE
jgi:hypothetical protein